jgi:hypothetical protein
MMMPGGAGGSRGHLSASVRRARMSRVAAGHHDAGRRSRSGARRSRSPGRVVTGTLVRVTDTERGAYERVARGRSRPSARRPAVDARPGPAVRVGAGYCLILRDEDQTDLSRREREGRSGRASGAKGAREGPAAQKAVVW